MKKESKNYTVSFLKNNFHIVVFIWTCLCSYRLLLTQWLRQKTHCHYRLEDIIEFLHHPHFHTKPVEHSVHHSIVRHHWHLRNIVLATCFDISALAIPASALANSEITLDVLAIRAADVPAEQIHAQVKMANTILDNSGFDQNFDDNRPDINVRLVGDADVNSHEQIVDYRHENTELALYEFMGAFKRQSGFVLSSAHRHEVFSHIADLRARTSADVVVLFLPTAGNDTDYCGQAPVLRKFDPRYGFAVIRVGEACKGRLHQDLIHELGHILGLEHSKRQSPQGGMFSYGVGHGIERNFVTVMAYRRLFDAPKRLLRFSEPTLDGCKGFSCGDQETNAVFAIQQTAPLVARFGENLLPLSDRHDNFPNAEIPGLVSGYPGEKSLHQSGQIDYAGDTDVFKISLQSGRQYIIEVNGQAESDTPLHSLQILGIFTPNRRLISDTSLSGEDKTQLVFSPAQDTDYYVAVGSPNQAYGDYEFHVREEVPNSAQTNVEVFSDTPIDNQIDYPSDQDWYTTYFNAGQTYVIQGTGASETLSPNLHIYDSHGQVVAGASDSLAGHVELKFTASHDDYYYVAAGASTEQTGQYTLQILPIERFAQSDAVDADEIYADTMLVDYSESASY